VKRLTFLAPLIAAPLLLTACDIEEPAESCGVEIDIDAPRGSNPKIKTPKAPANKAPSTTGRRR